MGHRLSYLLRRCPAKPTRRLGRVHRRRFPRSACGWRFALRSGIRDAFLPCCFSCCCSRQLGPWDAETGIPEERGGGCCPCGCARHRRVAALPGPVRQPAERGRRIETGQISRGIRTAGKTPSIESRSTAVVRGTTPRSPVRATAFRRNIRVVRITATIGMTAVPIRIDEQAHRFGDGEMAPDRLDRNRPRRTDAARPARWASPAA